MKYVRFTDEPAPAADQNFFGTKEVSAERQFCYWYDENRDEVNILFVTQGGSNLRIYITVFYEDKPADSGVGDAL